MSSSAADESRTQMPNDETALHKMDIEAANTARIIRSASSYTGNPQSSMEATITELANLKARQGDEPLHGHAIETIQTLLKQNGAPVAVTGVYDKKTLEAIKKFQREHVDKSGFELSDDGELDEATIETLFHARRRFVAAVANFVLIIFVSGAFFFWNTNFWTVENKFWKDAINIFIVSALAVLFGIRSVSALIVPGASSRIRAFWYRFQTKPLASILLLILLSAAIGLNLFFPSQGFVAPIPKDKQIVRIAIVLNGDAPYARDVMNGFIAKTDELLGPTKYSPSYEVVTGQAEVSKYEDNKPIFQELLSRFPGGRPDYLVPIGTQVSVFAYKNYLNKIPIIFAAVTDPIRSELVKTLEKDSGRGNIAGVTYGIPPLTRISFIAKTFPGRHVGFVYNPEFPQDVIMKNQIEGLASTTTPPLQVTWIEVKEPQLTAEQLNRAELFFGYYYLNSNFSKFASASSKPFIGATLADAQRSAIATIANDDKKLGVIAAENILFRNLIRGIALPDLNIESPDTAIVALNLNVARRYGITIPEDSKKQAQLLFDY